ncbi:hypothetical protein CSUB01_02475 [Colletotrichum sublineola]|uniref:Uncharacterized protein n=1 Tax=Colletotrichum sublineola TaxID=1173701 RepID=A0A066X942_COLSU|nr:hypothetical protein CSUB01_02475 [Colletotrichum sublineola]
MDRSDQITKVTKVATSRLSAAAIAEAEEEEEEEEEEIISQSVLSTDLPENLGARPTSMRHGPHNMCLIATLPHLAISGNEQHQDPYWQRVERPFGEPAEILGCAMNTE